MSDHPLTVTDPGPTDALDHAQEFVNIVLMRTPGAYRELLDSPLIRQKMADNRTFNHGKLYAWAEFLVFRSEFLQRFPEASQSACVNAFSGLFLKNDISMTNFLHD